MTNKLLETIKKQKWITIIIICIILLVFLHYSNTFDTLEHAEGSVSNNGKKTVRRLLDFYTPKTIADVRIINLKCRAGDIEYYLAKINKNKFKSPCTHCNKSKIEDSVLVLVKTKNTIKNNCIVEELVKCYNSDNIADCAEYVGGACPSNKFEGKNLEFILDNIDEGTKETTKDGVLVNASDQSFSLRFNDPEISGLMVSLFEYESASAPVPVPVPESTPTNTSAVNDNVTSAVNDNVTSAVNDTVTVIKKNYLVCLDEIVGAISNKQKVYINTEGLPNDTIRFKLYFNFGDNNIKYLGACKKDKCINVSCENEEECGDDYKYLCLYDNINDDNVLIFEPKLVRHGKV